MDEQRERELDTMITRGLGVPPELLEGDTTYSTTVIAMRQLTRNQPEGSGTDG